MALKISELPELTSLGVDDLIEVSEDTGLGSYASKKLKLSTELALKLGSIAEDPTPELGGELNAGAHTIGFIQQTGTGSGAKTIDWTLGNKFKFTLGALNETFSFTAPTNACSLLMLIIQDSVGGRDITWPATVKWLGAEPNWSLGGASKGIIASFYFDGTTYWGQGTPWEA
jgi:hypothetical protein